MEQLTKGPKDAATFGSAFIDACAAHRHWSKLYYFRPNLCADTICSSRRIRRSVLRIKHALDFDSVRLLRS